MGRGFCCPALTKWGIYNVFTKEVMIERAATDLLLFGSTDLTNILNTDIFLNVQKFIISSKRFTS
jgi:hypothetical protein